MALVSFNAPWKHQATSGFLMYFGKYKNTPVPWNGLNIFFKDMSAECWYSCLFHNKACFLTVGVGVNSSCSQILGSTSFFYVFLYKRTKLKRIFWFFTFSLVYTPKISQTRHSNWQKIKKIHFFCNPVLWPLILWHILCWVRIYKWKIVNLIK